MNMTRHLVRVLGFAAGALALHAAGCGGAGVGQADDPLALLSEGRYAEARATILERGMTAPRDRAIVAVSLVAENPSQAAGEEAVKALSEGTSGVGAAAAAADMLEIAFEIPPIENVEFSIVLVETAVGAVGQGPYAPATAPVMPVGAASRALAVSVLERIYLALAGRQILVDFDRILEIWNACYSLTGGATEAADDVEAWRMFHSLGGLAVIINDAAPDSDLAGVLLGASVSVLERNPSIAIAARCDLSSPFEGLKQAVAYKRRLLVRLEGAVAAATGCTRGTYAPEVR
jgi:hypothetical protein